MSDSVAVGPIAGGRFIVTVRWTNRDKSEGVHQVTVAATSVFVANGPMGTKLKRPPCRIADSIIQAVQKYRRKQPKGEE